MSAPDEGSPYIVCELLEGKTLRTSLANGALPVRLAIDYALQIVHGLIAAHDHRIVHRDLKPENLFVTTDGRLKILDFGVAKLQSTPEDSGRSVEELTTVTKAGAVIGTVAYMSPEQLRGKAVDHRSDIFSVGAILYEMLSGRRPFRGETEVDTITAVLREDPPELSPEQSNIPDSVQLIVRHCLEKEPENRFQSARDLAFALETLADATGARQLRFRSSRTRLKILPWAIAGVCSHCRALAGNAVAARKLRSHRTVDSPLSKARYTPRVSLPTCVRLSTAQRGTASHSSYFPQWAIRS